MLLADVYMRLGEYANAVTPLKDVINSGKFALATNDNLAEGSAFNKLRTTDDRQRLFMPVNMTQLFLLTVISRFTHSI